MLHSEDMQQCDGHGNWRNKLWYLSFSALTRRILHWLNLILLFTFSTIQWTCRLFVRDYASETMYFFYNSVQPNRIDLSTLNQSIHGLSLYNDCLFWCSSFNLENLLTLISTNWNPLLPSRNKGNTVFFIHSFLISVIGA